MRSISWSSSQVRLLGCTLSARSAAWAHFSNLQTGPSEDL
jgi:hypothetical protein